MTAFGLGIGGRHDGGSGESAVIASAIIAGLRANGVRLTVREGVLHAGPSDRLSPDHRAVIAARKADLITELLDPSGAREQETQQRGPGRWCG
jgi:hypothetical protein